jgi:hypothetical protein
VSRALPGDKNNPRGMVFQNHHRYAKSLSLVSRRHSESGLFELRWLVHTSVALISSFREVGSPRHCLLQTARGASKAPLPHSETASFFLFPAMFHTREPVLVDREFARCVDFVTTHVKTLPLEVIVSPFRVGFRFGDFIGRALRG